MQPGSNGRRGVVSGVALAALVAGSSWPALAAPLDPEGCGKLKVEVAGLEARGVRAAMAQGPVAAKATLPAERLAQIRQLLDAESQLRFRCPLEAAFVVLKDEPPDEPGDAAGADQGAVVAPVARKKPATPKAAAVPPAKAAVKPVPAAADAATAPKPAAKAAAAPAKTDAAPVKTEPEPKAAQPVAAEPAPAKIVAKPRPKPRADDSYRPPASADVNATPLDKQAAPAKTP